MLHGGRRPPMFIHSWGEYSVGYTAQKLGLNAIFTNGQGWRATNRVVYIPFRLPFSYTARQLYVQNGSNATGNFELAVLNLAGIKLITTGTTAMSGTNAPQKVGLTTGGTLAPGRYFWGVTLSSTSGALEIISPNTLVVPHAEVMGILKESSDPVSFGVPSTATFAAPLNGDVPLVGMTNQATFTTF